jgi:Ca2+-transporting ATPase
LGLVDYNPFALSSYPIKTALLIFHRKVWFQHKYNLGGADMDQHWWTMEKTSVLEELSTDPRRGLSQKDADQRRIKYGENEMEHAAPISPLHILIVQFADFMVLVLLGAAAVSAILGELADAGVILAIIIVNAVLGLIQEYRAERSLAALKRLSAPQARVIRDGKRLAIDNRLVVPGDIMELEAGDRIGADARVLVAEAIEVNESALTGESMSVAKSIKPIKRRELPLGDRSCMVYAGTTVTKGRGQGVVVGTGMSTELGKIAHLLESAETSVTPLQRRLEQLGRYLVYICLFICAAVATIGIMRGESFRLMFLSGVSLAVAAIPEGLPAIVTISLAIGVQRMIRRNVLIRKLPAVETLGCATTICSDKTGTITQNQMVVTQIAIRGKNLTVTGEGFRPQGEILDEGHPWRLSPQKDGGETHFFQVLNYCNNAKLFRSEDGSWAIIGDPTEGALLALAKKAGYSINESSAHRIGEIPFSSERRRMSVAITQGSEVFLYVKGSLDTILDRSDKVLTTEGIRSINSTDRRFIEEMADNMAGSALRVLAVAYRPLASGVKHLTEEHEQKLTFLGLVGMMDPPRAEVKEAIRRCHKAGIRTVMITGDHPITASAIASEIGLTKRERVVTGAELERLDAKNIDILVSQADIYARVSPNHKLLLVKALKRRGEVVAMTGDGVNDAPAVKEASIGVAMGNAGTDVTKESSSMVITDDNFASIVAAIEEGRGIYENIRKSIRYLLGCNIGEVLTMFGASVLGLPLPLTPLQILWTNLVTDGLPAVALSLDPPEKGLMDLPPRAPNEGIFGRGLGKRILLQGVAIGSVTLGIFVFTLRSTENLIAARTIAFASLVFCQLGYVFVCRSERKPIWRASIGKNPYLLGAVALSGIMQLITMNLPALQGLFSTITLSSGQWVWVGLAALCSIAVAESVSGSHRVWKRRRRIFTT